MASRMKVNDLRTLQMEKERLQMQCELHEVKIKTHLREFTHDFDKLFIQTVLPFEKETNEKVDGLLEIINRYIFSIFTGSSWNEGKNSFNRRMIKSLQAVLISISFRLLRKIFSNKTGKEKEASQPA